MSYVLEDLDGFFSLDFFFNFGHYIGHTSPFLICSHQSLLSTLVQLAIKRLSDVAVPSVAEH